MRVGGPEGQEGSRATLRFLARLYPSKARPPHNLPLFFPTTERTILPKNKQYGKKSHEAKM